MSQKLSIEKQEDSNATYLTIKGVIDEDADFKGAFSGLKPKVTIDLEGISFINSCGVREWVRAIQELPKGAEVQLLKCAPRIVEQTNYVANFTGAGKIVSFFAPYYCPKCQKERTALLQAADFKSGAPDHAPAQKCPNCGTKMDFDDIEEEYFSFLDR
jgi:anti-anti-sigma regulatory factor